MATPYSKSKKTRSARRKSQLSDDDSMPDRSQLAAKRKRFRTPLIREINDDDCVVVSDATPRVTPPSNESNFTAKMEDEDDVKTESLDAPVANMMTSMFGMMQSHANLVRDLTLNAGNLSRNPSVIPEPAPGETTSSRHFLRFINMYVKSLDSEHLKNLSEKIDRKVEETEEADVKIPIDKFRLAVEAAVGIIIA